MEEVSAQKLPDAPILPADLSSCHVLLAEQARTIVEMQQSRIERDQAIEDLKLQLAKLQQQLYGRRSERVADDPNQAKLDFGDDPEAQDALADAAAEAEEIVEEIVARRKKKKGRKPRNGKLPEHIERYEVIAPATDEQTNCPTHGERQLIGYDETETLEFLRPVLRVRVTKYPKYICPDQPECGVKQPPRPEGLVEGNRYDTSVGAEVVTARFGYHLPYYRQQDWFAGSGWTPSRSTLLNISAAVAEIALPLADYYRQLLIASGGVGCDETRVTLIVPPTIPQVDADDPRSRRIHEVLSRAHAEGRKSIDARMWAYREFELPVNVFDFTVSRHRDGPDEFLEGYTGNLMADCWSGFQKIELRSDARIVRGACWSHARRKVFEARGNQPQHAAVLLAMIRELYDIEDRGKLVTADDRRALRERESRGVLARIRAYLDSEPMNRVLPKSVFGEALTYLRNHWDALQVFVTDGRMPIDNNDVEQLMKQLAIGRKNWLFLGSIEAGRRAATLLTIISTAVRNDLDVWAYLKDVLDQLLAGSTDYHSLRADVWKCSHPDAQRSYRADERRDAADRRHYRRAERRLAGRTAAAGE
ncbi:MAG TPA: IS66 family transposase [Candidatus Baltobacteraceae bacterium]|nr:IS66 family transposase [Candidatus Baltobacteraceae bacterium]